MPGWHSHGNCNDDGFEDLGEQLASGLDLDLGHNEFPRDSHSGPAAYAGNIQVFYGTTSYAVNTASGGTTTADTTGSGSTRVITIPASVIPKDGAFHTYRVDLGLEPLWRATLRDLRMDPVYGAGRRQCSFGLLYFASGSGCGLLLKSQQAIQWSRWHNGCVACGKPQVREMEQSHMA